MNSVHRNAAGAIWPQLCAAHRGLNAVKDQAIVVGHEIKVLHPDLGLARRWDHHAEAARWAGGDIACAVLGARRDAIAPYSVEDQGASIGLEGPVVQAVVNGG